VRASFVIGHALAVGRTPDFLETIDLLLPCPLRVRSWPCGSCRIGPFWECKQTSAGEELLQTKLQTNHAAQPSTG
jgi:hypothetical protein